MHGSMSVKNRRLTTYNTTLGRVRIVFIPPSCIKFRSKKNVFLMELGNVATNNKTYLWSSRKNYPILSKFGVSRQIFIKSLPPSTKFHGNQSSVCVGGGAALTHAHSRTDRRTEMMCLIGAFLRLCQRA